MGVLDVGDKLPTVKEVVAKAAVNPNTVMQGLLASSSTRAWWRGARASAPSSPAVPRARLPTPPAPAGPQPGAPGCRRPARRGSTTTGIESMVRATLARSRSRGNRVNGQDAPAIPHGRAGEALRVLLWALQDCSVSVPRGRVSALVGPNGAGEDHAAEDPRRAERPQRGRGGGAGRAPGQNTEFLDSVGYLAQDVPLYKRLSAGDHLEIGAHLTATGTRARPGRGWPR